MAMYGPFIKDQVLENKRKVYSLIVSIYRQQLDDLQPLMFRRWLSREIGVPEEKINLSSLNSALARQRKKDGKKMIMPRVAGEKKNDKDTFRFSSVDGTTTKSRTTEL